MVVETDINTLKAKAIVRILRQTPEARRSYRSIKEHEISIGDKHLTLAIGIRPNGEVHASTKIRKVEDIQYLPQATTVAYCCALELMRSYANKTGRLIHYEAITPNEKMKAWIKDPQKGAMIFDWDELFEEDSTDILHAKKIIRPENS